MLKYPKYIMRRKMVCEMERDAVDISRWNPTLSMTNSGDM